MKGTVPAIYNRIPRNQVGKLMRAEALAAASTYQKLSLKEAGEFDKKQPWSKASKKAAEAKAATAAVAGGAQ